jgi:hypothetical protein
MAFFICFENPGSAFPAFAGWLVSGSHFGFYRPVAAARSLNWSNWFITVLSFCSNSSFL